MIGKVTVGDKEFIAILLNESFDLSWIDNYRDAIKNALLAISMSNESKDALTSTSMYFLLQLENAMEKKGG